MNILGLSAFFHDSAAALTVGGRVLAAAQEERFSRQKHDKRFPAKAIEYCLQASGLGIEALDCVMFYESPAEKFKRLAWTYLSFAPQGFESFARVLPLWVMERRHQKAELLSGLRRFGRFPAEKLHFTDHHLSHAASAFFPSPFKKASILVMDGVGEFATTTLAQGRGKDIRITQQLEFPHSLGMLYGAFTHHLGFKVNSGEYKVMGLAPYGQPRYLDQIFEHLVDLKADGSFRLDQQYFDYCTGLRMTNERFDALFGGPRRPAEAELTPRHFDIAASIQAATERIALAIARHLAASDTTGNLCLAGGVALNCVANRKILQHSGFKKIWIQPAAGDAGNALGAALVAHHHLHGQDREPAAESDAMQGCYLGPAYAQNEVEARLAAQGAVFSVLGDEALMAETAQSLAQGQVVGWFQGRMEFGPRALGNRSILADPRSAQMQRDLNLKVKFRESFRPFAPSVLAEAAGEWFDLDRDSPYMLFVAPVHESRRLPPAGAGGEALPALERLMQPRSTIPAVTHLDHSARVQTVHQDTNPRFHRLLSAFQSRTGCPVLVNTSFNVRGEPIVNTPEEAFVCFMTTGIDVLVVGNCLLTKTAQTVTITDRPNFAPD